MTGGAPRKPFARRASFDQRELVGARWWAESMNQARAGAATVTRRKALVQIAVAAGVVGGLGALIAALTRSSSSPPPTSGGGAGGRELALQKTGFDETTFTQQALDAQRANGWDVGSSGVALDWPDACDVDAAGERVVVDAGFDLAAALAPAQPRLAPWYVSTLFQSLDLSNNASLRAALRPIFSPAMDAAFSRGASVRGLFEGVGSPTDVAVVVDLPGPEAVAFAAGLAPRFDAVFTFDNWPHPKGVVPSHLALAAALYYRRFLAKNRAAPGAPPALVLDRARLSPYVDDAGRFDNRYLAKIPDVEGFKTLGVKHVLYVVPAGETKEMDDLNDDFVALHDAAIDVKLLPLSDLERPKDAVVAASRPGTPVAHGHHYGGSPMTHWWFWHHYPWYARPSRFNAVAPTTVSRGYDFTPRPRSTLFSTGVPGGLTGTRARPRGFGTVTFHRPTPTQPSSGGRSGSLGRGTTSIGG